MGCELVDLIEHGYLADGDVIVPVEKALTAKARRPDVTVPPARLSGNKLVFLHLDKREELPTDRPQTEV